MNPASPGSPAAILAALGHGLPILIVQIVACAVLLVIAVTIYVNVTPFRERELVMRGNPAAGTSWEAQSWRWRSRWRRRWRPAALCSIFWCGAWWR
jgi:hypothetical protein